MRISERALENIRAVIEQQETEWLKENGFDPVPHKPEPRIFRRKVKEGNFSADRFLGITSTAPAQKPEEPKRELSPAPEPEEPQQDNTPEAVEIIPQKDGRHSWLYNEVMKAIHDAAGDGRNTKIIAVFVPVVQNGREFEDLPVSAKVEVSPVNEEDVRIDIADITEEAPAPVEPEPEAEEHLPEPLEEPEDVASLEPEPEPEQEQEPEQEELPSPVEPEPELEEVPEEEEAADHVGDLLPPPQAEPDPELAEAFNTMEEKLDEVIAETQDILEDEEEESKPQIMPFTEIEDSDQEKEPADLLPLPDPTEIMSVDESEDDSETDSTDEEIIDEPPVPAVTLPEVLEDDEVIEDGIEIQEDLEDNIKL